MPNEISTLHMCLNEILSNSLPAGYDAGNERVARLAREALGELAKIEETLPAGYDTPRPVQYRIRFDGPPGPEGGDGTFVEVETMEGASFRLGVWAKDTESEDWFLLVDETQALADANAKGFTAAHERDEAKRILRNSLEALCQALDCAFTEHNTDLALASKTALAITDLQNKASQLADTQRQLRLACSKLGCRCIWEGDERVTGDAHCPMHGSYDYDYESFTYPELKSRVGELEMKLSNAE